MDTAMPEATDQIKANIQKLGFKLADLELILNTHAHFDHTGGFAEIKSETGAALVAGAADQPLLEGGYYPGQETERALKFPAVKVDRAVREGDVVTLGPISLTAHETPGHSPGCRSWTMDVKDGGEAHKIIFFCSATVALNQLVKTPTYLGIVEDYRSTFKRAALLDGDVFLAPHPETYGMETKRAALAEGKPNPFVKPGEFHAYVATLQSAFEDALAKEAWPRASRLALINGGDAAGCCQAGPAVRSAPSSSRNLWAGTLFPALLFHPGKARNVAIWIACAGAYAEFPCFRARLQCFEYIPGRSAGV
jgi:metallo-beta-lactamase class B